MAAMRTRITELPNQLTSSIDAADAVVRGGCKKIIIMRKYRNGVTRTRRVGS